MKYIIYLFLFTIFASTTKGEERKIQVVLDIQSAENRAEIYSFTSRELRSLGDVAVVTEFDFNKGGPYFQISLIVVHLLNRNGEKSGYAISCIIENKVDVPGIKDFLKTRLNERELKAATLGIKNSTTIEEHKLIIAGPDELQTICQKLISNFDGVQLKRTRAITEMLDKAGITNKK